MTQFWNRIAVWSSLHELVQIFGSSHELVSELSLYRVHNEHEFRSGLGLLLPVRIARTSTQCCNMQPTHTMIYIHVRTHTYTTYMHVLMHTPKHTQYIYIHVYNTLLCTHIIHHNAHANICTNMPIIYWHIQIHAHAHTQTHAHTSCMHIIKYTPTFIMHTHN